MRSSIAAASIGTKVGLGGILRGLQDGLREFADLDHITGQRAALVNVMDAPHAGEHQLLNLNGGASDDTDLALAQSLVDEASVRRIKVPKIDLD